MGSESGFDEKIDVIDLIISVLREHEKKLDELVSRLEEAQTGVTPIRAPREREQKEIAPSGEVTVLATVKRWTEFTERCSSAGLVAFDIEDGRFRVSAVSGDVLYTYEEDVPDMEIRYRKTDEKAHVESIDVGRIELLPAALRGKLDCGLPLEKREVEVSLPDGGFINKVSFYVDPGMAKSWLAYQLQADDDSVVQGALKV